MVGDCEASGPLPKPLSDTERGFESLGVVA